MSTANWGNLSKVFFQIRKVKMVENNCRKRTRVYVEFEVRLQNATHKRKDRATEMFRWEEYAISARDRTETVCKIDFSGFYSGDGLYVENLLWLCPCLNFSTRLFSTGTQGGFGTLPGNICRYTCIHVQHSYPCITNKVFVYLNYVSEYYSTLKKCLVRAMALFPKSHSWPESYGVNPVDRSK